MRRRGVPSAPAQLPADALPSWNDTAAMATILTFVEGVIACYRRLFGELPSRTLSVRATRQD
jgi:hypothetical protein